MTTKDIERLIDLLDKFASYDDEANVQECGHSRGCIKNIRDAALDALARLVNEHEDETGHQGFDYERNA